MRTASKALFLIVSVAALLAVSWPGARPAASPGAGGATVVAFAQGPALTTTGPTPPPSVRPPVTRAAAGVALAPGDEHLIAGVPAYLWRDGCGPTSVGMVVGYYDDTGFDTLISGAATTQTAAVQQAIASHQEPGGGARHYEDFALPLETGSVVLADRSEPPVGDEHASDSVADFMRTSWSIDGSTYGSSWSDAVGPGFVAYVESRGLAAAPGYRDFYYDAPGSSALTFAVLAAEIDAGRPMVLLVDSSGDGVTDHAVAAIGYRETSGYPEYACFDTWYATVRWQRFRGLSPAYDWGIWGGTALTLVAPSPSPSPLPSESPSPSQSADTTPPTTTVFGHDDLWHAGPVTLTFVASDAGSGVLRTESSVSLTDWVAGGERVVQGQGLIPVSYRSVDVAGNAETPKGCVVKIDSAGPRTAAWASSVRRGAVASLRYRVSDRTPTARVKIVVRTRAGAWRKTFLLGMRGTGTTFAWRFRCRLGRGVYRYFVYATDEAGNREAYAGRALLTVK